MVQPRVFGRAAGQTAADRQRAPVRGPQVPLEVAAGRRAAEAVAALARSPEGKAAIRQTARLVRAVRAAATPVPRPAEKDEPDRP